MSLKDELTAKEKEELAHIMKNEPVPAKNVHWATAVKSLLEKGLILRNPRDKALSVNWDKLKR